MAPKLTRRGARNVTSASDDLATLYQTHYATLGLPKELALDLAKKMDIASDLIELRAASNFPMPREAADVGAPEFGSGEGESPETAGVDGESGGQTSDKPSSTGPLNKPMSEGGKAAKKKAVDETGLSLNPGNGGWDPGVIGDDVGGPQKQESDESSYMSGHFSQEQNQQLRQRQESGSLPAVDKAAAAFPALINHFGKAAAAGWSVTAASQGFAGRIGELDALRTAAEGFVAEIDAVCSNLTASADVQKAVEGVRASLTAEIGQQVAKVTACRKSLVEASAKLKVASRGGLDAENLAGVTAKYDTQVVAFIAEANEILAEQRAALDVFSEGVQLLQSTDKQASLRDLGARFSDWLAGDWKSLTKKLATATRLIGGAAAAAAQSHSEFVAALGGLGKQAANRLAGDDEVEAPAEESDSEGGKKASDDDDAESDAEADDDEDEDDEADAEGGKKASVAFDLFA